MLIGLAALAGFTLTMGGWKPVSPSYVAGITFVSSETQFGLYRGGVGPHSGRGRWQRSSCCAAGTEPATTPAGLRASLRHQAAPAQFGENGFRHSGRDVALAALANVGGPGLQLRLLRNSLEPLCARALRPARVTSLVMV